MKKVDIKLLNNAISLATCLVSLEKEIHRKLQIRRSYTKQSRAAASNGLKPPYNHCQPKKVARQVAKAWFPLHRNVIVNSYDENLFCQTAYVLVNI